MSKKAIFISYSWEEEEHQAWVKKFSDDLQTRLGNNYEVLLDQNLPRGFPLTRFMEIGLEDSERVLVIGTPTYKKKSRDGKGVAFEHTIISSEIFNIIDTTKFYPILRKGSFVDSFPLALRGRIGDDFTKDTYYEKNLQTVVNAIINDNPIPDIFKQDSNEEIAEIDVVNSELNQDNTPSISPSDIIAQALKNYKINGPKVTIEEIQKVIDKNPNYAAAIYIKALLEFEMGNKVEAKKIYDYALEIKPDVVVSFPVRNLLTGKIKDIDNRLTMNRVRFSRLKKELNHVPEDKLWTFIIPKGVNKIGEAAFNNCTSLTSIIIPNSVTEIGRAAFWYCTNLSSIRIPNGVIRIGDGAFSGCTSLTSIKIPDGVTMIGERAFKGCTGLTSIEIPNNVTEIGLGVFWGCTSLTSIVIPNSVTKIGNYAFSSCSSLTSIVIPDSVTEIGFSAFADCSSLTSIEIPDSVTKIGWSAFENCSSLASIVIPDSVTEIRWNAFEGCTSLKSIVIPDSVTVIWWSAFKGCTSLTEIHLKHASPVDFSKAFMNFYDSGKNLDVSKITLYVPKGSVEAYENDSFYKDFNVEAEKEKEI